MCYGAMISESLERAKRSFHCSFCRRVMPASEEHIQQRFEDGETKTFKTKIIGQRACQSCIATTTADGAFDDDGCLIDYDAREGARRAGWKKVKEAWKAMRMRLAKKGA